MNSFDKAAQYFQKLRGSRAGSNPVGTPIAVEKVGSKTMDWATTLQIPLESSPLAKLVKSSIFEYTHALGVDSDKTADHNNWMVTKPITGEDVTRAEYNFSPSSLYFASLSISEEQLPVISSQTETVKTIEMPVSEDFSFVMQVKDPKGLRKTDNHIPKISVRQITHHQIKQDFNVSDGKPVDVTLGTQPKLEHDHKTYPRVTQVEVTLNTKEFKGTLTIEKRGELPGKVSLAYDADLSKVKHSSRRSKPISMTVDMPNIAKTEAVILKEYAEQYADEPLVFAKMVIQRATNQTHLDILQRKQKTKLGETTDVNQEVLVDLVKLFNSLGYSHGESSSEMRSKTISNPEGMAMLIGVSIGKSGLNLRESHVQSILEKEIHTVSFKSETEQELKTRIDAIETQSEDSQKTREAIVKAEHQKREYYDDKMYYDFGIMPVWSVPNDMDTFYQTGITNKSRVKPSAKFYEWKILNENLVTNRLRAKYAVSLITGNPGDPEMYQQLLKDTQDLQQKGEWFVIPSPEALQAHYDHLLNALKTAIDPSSKYTREEQDQLIPNIVERIKSTFPDRVWHHGMLSPNIVGAKSRDRSISGYSGELKTIKVGNIDLTLGVSAFIDQNQIGNEVLSLTLAQGEETKANQSSELIEPLTYFVEYQDGVAVRRRIHSQSIQLEYTAGKNDTPDSNIYFGARDSRNILNFASFDTIEAKIYQYFRETLGTEII